MSSPSHAEEVTVIVGALSEAQERVTYICPAPRAFPLSRDIARMRWYAVGGVFVIMSPSGTHTVPLGRADLDQQWKY